MIGDTQHLPGYSLLSADSLEVDQLTDHAYDDARSALRVAITFELARVMDEAYAELPLADG